MNSEFLKNLKKSLDNRDLTKEDKNLDKFSNKMKEILFKADNIKGDASSRVRERIGKTKERFTIEEVQKIEIEERKRMKDLKKVDNGLLQLTNIEKMKKSVENLEVERDKFIIKVNNDIQEKKDIINNMVENFKKEYGDIEEFMLQS